MVAQGSADLNCYSCTYPTAYGVNNSNCLTMTDPSSVSTTTVYGSNVACLKQIVTYEGKQVVTRGGDENFDEYDLVDKDSGCMTTTSSKGNAYTCFCTSNLCNPAMRIGSPSLANLLVTFLVYCVLKTFKEI